MDHQSSGGLPNSAASGLVHETAVALLTGGSDRSYVLGLAMELLSGGAILDVIGSDELDCPEFRGKAGLNFLNLRGDQNPRATPIRKVLRVSGYYAKLIRYAATAKPKIFHILWNNKFQFFDRTLLMLYYRLLGKKIVITVHNVNERKRDRRDTPLNRLTLRIQYRLAAYLFVHTEKMKQELIDEFGVQTNRISVIPLGINDAFPNTSLTPRAAKQRLGIGEGEKVILFFGRITPYKGLEYLVGAFQKLLTRSKNYRLLVAGRLEKGCEGYWNPVREAIREDVERGQVLLRAEFIPDEETEIYFKGADVLVLPYRHIYQSGVLSLGYSFGIPTLASDVGSLKDEIVEGKTGFVFRPEDPDDLANVIETYFTSALYADLGKRRREIREFAAARYSWKVVGQTTMKVYADLLRMPPAGRDPVVN